MSCDKRVRLHVDPRAGYAAHQISNVMTLFDLKRLVDNAIDEHGQDALVVTYDEGNKFGAAYGRVNIYNEIDPAPGDDDE